MSAPKLSIEVSRFEGVRVFPKDLIINEDENGRKFLFTKGDIEDLLTDLESGVGIKSPIVVNKAEGGTLKVVRGFRRATAALVFSNTHPEYKIPALVESPKDKLEALVLNIRENVARKDLSPIDHGHNAQLLQAGGKSLVEIGEILGCSDSQVSQNIKLVEELSERLQILVHRRKLTRDDAFTLLKVQDPEERERIVQELLKAEGKAIETEAMSVEESGAKRRVSSRGGVVRKAARDAGANVGALRLPEFKKYLKLAVEEDGPGSNKGEVELKAALLSFLAGEITEKQLDNRFDKCCKSRV